MVAVDQAVAWFKDIVLLHYFDFKGRAGRTEFWNYVVVYVACFIALYVVETLLDTAILLPIFELGLLLPSLAIGARRLHDIGKSGWWQLLHLVFIAGTIVLIYWFVQDGQKGANAYGSEPRTHPPAPDKKPDNERD
jgi:uncharacterized membrane protein YhaH (DUF805 family)